MIYNSNSPLFRFLTKAADLIILNILFLVCCIPVVTIGAAATALYSVTLKMVKDEHSRIAAGFFLSFHQNFRQSTLCWLGCLVLIALVAADMAVLKSLEPSVATTVLSTLLLMVCAVAFAWGQYLFAFLARFKTSLKEAVKNSLLLMIAYLPKSVMMVIMWTAAAAASFSGNLVLSIAMVFWPMMGFAVLTLGCSYFLRKIFDSITSEGSDPLENTDYKTNER